MFLYLQSQVDVYKLKPNSSYIFEVWASNELGEGEIVQVEATTNHNSEEIGEFPSLHVEKSVTGSSESH